MAAGKTDKGGPKGLPQSLLQKQKGDHHRFKLLAPKEKGGPGF